MIDIKNVFPECDADTLLVELIFLKGRSNHKHGKSKVETALKEKKGSNDKLIGLVDFDKFKNEKIYKYLIEFSEQKHNLKDKEEALIIKKLPHKEHYLIYIYPVFEKWILKQAELASIRFADFEIKNYNEFVNLSKTYGRIESKKFKNFVRAVVNANPPGVKLLKDYLMVS